MKLSLVVPTFLWLAAPLFGGCSSETIAQSRIPPSPTLIPLSGSDASEASSDASTSSAAQSADGPVPGSDDAGSPRGSTHSLCGLSSALLPAGCNPDSPNTPLECGFEPDGAAAVLMGSSPDAALACHLVRASPDASAAPTCTLPGTMASGENCSNSTDCGAGSECVLIAGGAAVCRRYCCAGNVLCRADEFCDLEAAQQSNPHHVPVCSPITPCSLGDQLDGVDRCGTGKTCAVAREQTGQTSCTPVGNARAGETCEEDNCAVGLTCLGTWGSRICYALCHTGPSVDCSSGQACTGGLPLFTEPAVGVCQ